MLKVVLADDHRLILDSIKRALEEDGGFQMVGEASSGERVLPLVARVQPDLVVLDLRMPGMDGLSAWTRSRSGIPTRRWSCSRRRPTRS